MNIKLLKELYKQAETECGWSEEKFAELIVQEILRLLEQYSRDSFPKDFIDDFDKGYLAGLSTAQEAVKKHFGVEL